jgi:hypothetical protein
MGSVFVNVTGVSEEINAIIFNVIPGNIKAQIIVLSHRVLVGKPEGKRPLLRPRLR